MNGIDWAILAGITALAGLAVRSGWKHRHDPCSGCSGHGCCSGACQRKRRMK